MKSKSVFPVNPTEYSHITHFGLTLRDYAAVEIAKALVLGKVVHHSRVANETVKLTDELIEKLEEK